MNLKITNENYYDVPMMSASTFKAFDECEHRGLAIYKGKYKFKPTKAMLMGLYIDAWCEGTLDKFKENHSELFKKNGTLKADYIQADKAIESIKSEPLFMEYLKGNKQTILIGEIDGVPFKGKLDIGHDERIVDLKYLRTCDRVMGKSLVEHWGYDNQGTIYQELEFQKTGVRKPYYLAIITKESPPNLEIVQISQQNLNIAMEYIKSRLPRIVKIINEEIQPMRCNCCEYCRQTKTLKEPIDSDLLGFSERDIKEIEGEI